MTDRNDPTLEQQLRRALRPTDPPAEFAERVTAAIARARSPAGMIPRARPDGLPVHHPWLGRRAWLPAAATAALVVVLAGAAALQHQHTQELRARAAHEQVQQALRISSEALNAALKVTVDPSRRG